MKKSSLKVSLKMSKLPVPEKINAATTYVKGVISNPAIFANSNTLTTSVTNAINALELAWKDAQDGGKTKTAIMHDKEDNLMKLMFDLAHYVESVANGDPSVVHLTGMDVKQSGIRHIPEFEVFKTTDSGAVGLRTRPHAKALFKWQYSTDPIGADSWVTSVTTALSKATIGELVAGEVYWFRVVVLTPNGETTLPATRFIVP